MAENRNDPEKSAAINAELAANREALWGTFMGATTFGLGAVALVLVLMAVFIG